MTVTPIQSATPLTCAYKDCPKINQKVSRCARCLQVAYCSKECQKNDWASHKISCKKQCEEQAISDAFTKALNLSTVDRGLAPYIEKTYQVVFQGKGVKEIQNASEMIVACYHGAPEEEVQNSIEIQKMLNQGDIYTIEGQASMSPFPGQGANPKFQILGWDFIEGGKKQLKEPPEHWTYVEKDSWVQQYGSIEEREASSNNPKRAEYYKKAEALWMKRQDNFIKTLEETAKLRKKFRQTKTVQLAGIDHLFKNPIRPFTHGSVQKVIDFLNQRGAIVLVPFRHVKLLNAYPQIQASNNNSDEKKQSKQPK